ncbi:unnamed protein product [Gongylonema pulchrum]|uniref:DUF2946 domain-containing protein n=1 Tax=Gongylonema pulchrum TaxID=637853 RepID=A0A183E4F4_9BILA|nr:unnamed protein product [Gongylonema pulchrum]
METISKIRTTQHGKMILVVTDSDSSVMDIICHRYGSGAPLNDLTAQMSHLTLDSGSAAAAFPPQAVAEVSTVSSGTMEAANAAYSPQRPGFLSCERCRENPPHNPASIHNCVGIIVFSSAKVGATLTKLQHFALFGNLTREGTTMSDSHESGALTNPREVAAPNEPISANFCLCQCALAPMFNSANAVYTTPILHPMLAGIALAYPPELLWHRGNID